MLLSRQYIWSLGLIVVGYLSVFSQPTCFTNYDVENYCDVSRSSTIIVVAQVKWLAPAEGYSMLRYSRAEIAIEQILKGEIGNIVTVDLPFGCAGNIEKGGTYIFNIEPHDGRSNLNAHHWARLDGLPLGHIAKTLKGLRSVLSGQRQPSITGRVTGPDTLKSASIKVTAMSDNDAFKTTTDRTGGFSFLNLPKGIYRVFVTYPVGFGPADQYDRPRETDERKLEIGSVDDRPCSQTLNFGMSLTAKITGTIDVGGQNGPPYPYFQLIDTNVKVGDADPIVKMESLTYPPPHGSREPIGFKFYHVPPGRYLLRFAFDRSYDRLTAFYYPGVRSVKDAEVIVIRAGTSLELNVHLPSFSLITISGSTRLADGTPIFGGVELIDAAAPTVAFPFSPADREREDIKFFFRFIRGRRFFLCAGYDGVKNGKQIRLYGKLAFEGDSDKSNVIVTLDKPIPTGVHWWDRCRKVP